MTESFSLKVSRLIYDMAQDYLNEAAKTQVETAAVLCFQSFGEFLRWNSHFHGIFLEGGFDQSGNFVYIPFSNLSQMTECFRRRVIKLFIEKKLINQHMADNLLRWRHSGFSIDSSIRLFGGSQQERENHTIADTATELRIKGKNRIRSFTILPV
ncbi:MAG TPA: hypothetical protein ENI06_10480 [Spirochaetales bacterium]|nr:hypothetical protein [Spirochaetales bacterium]